MILLVLGLLVAGLWLAWQIDARRTVASDIATPARVVAIGYAVLYGIGSVVLVATGESDGGGPLLACGSLVAFAIGGLLVARRSRWAAQPIERRMELGRVETIPAAALAAIGLAAYLLIAIDVGIPLLTGEAQSVRLAYGGLRMDLFRWLVPPAALLALGIALIRRQRREIVLAAVIAGGVVGLEILAASRALPFELGLAAVLLAWWAGVRLGLKATVAIVLAGSLVFFGVLFARASAPSGFQGPSDILSFAFNRSVGRVLLVHPRTIDVVVVTIPAEEPYFAGATYVRRVAAILGAPERPSLGAWLFGRLFPDEPPGGFAAPGLAAEGWANAGPILALGLMVLLGAGTAWFGDLVARSAPTLVNRVGAAIVTVALLRTYASSLNGLLLTLAAATAWWLIVGGRWRTLLASARSNARLRSERSPG